MKPTANETEKAFTNRFMNDEEMKSKFPNIDQRMAMASKMFKAAPQMEEFAELPGVEIFKAGTYYGLTYTDEDLKAIADNTNELIASGKHRSPAKLGHDDDQAFARMNGLPAVGWVSRLVQKGGSLFADFVNVPTVIAEAIAKKLYNSVSSEIYLEEHALREFGVKGKVLRAVAWLGADVPKVKGMSPLASFLSDKEAEVAIVKFSSEPAPKISNEEPSKPGEAGAGKASEEKPKEVTMTEQEIEALKAKALDAETKLAEALKFGEEEKAKRATLELKAKDDRIVAFMEKNKESLIPALQPMFKTLALAQSSVVKFDDKDVEPLDAFLRFTEEVLKAKKVDTKEIPDGDKSQETADKTAAEKLSETFRTSRKNVEGVTNADLAIRAEQYAEKNKVSFKDALLACSAEIKKEDK